MSAIQHLIQIMARLRDPEGGCPWDRQQDFASIAPYTIEEAYEVADAIAREDLSELREELGDLLFQVVFHAQMAKEQGAFDFEQVAEGICDKMLRRHPHVFGDAQIDSAEQLHHAWEKQKTSERADKRQHGVLDGVALALPALMRAQKLQKRAAKVGFDWPDIDGVLDKCREELDEFAAATDAGQRQEEIGDLLFSLVNLARHAGVDAEQALRAANGKFERRFSAMAERLAEQGMEPAAADAVQMDQAWEQVKREEQA